MLPLVGIEPLAQDSKSNMPLFYPNLTFACDTETLGSLYSHALLILTESSSLKIKWCMNRSLKIS